MARFCNSQLNVKKSKISRSFIASSDFQIVVTRCNAPHASKNFNKPFGTKNAIRIVYINNIAANC